MAQWLRTLTILKGDLVLPVTLVLDLTPPSGFCGHLYIHDAHMYALKINNHRRAICEVYSIPNRVC